MHYKIVQDKTISELEIKVNRNIKAGFVPIGGISTIIDVQSNSLDNQIFYQAMTYTKEPE